MLPLCYPRVPASEQSALGGPVSPWTTAGVSEVAARSHLELLFGKDFSLSFGMNSISLHTAQLLRGAPDPAPGCCAVNMLRATLRCLYWTLMPGPQITTGSALCEMCLALLADSSGGTVLRGQEEKNTEQTLEAQCTKTMGVSLPMN